MKILKDTMTVEEIQTERDIILKRIESYISQCKDMYAESKKGGGSIFTDIDFSVMFILERVQDYFKGLEKCTLEIKELREKELVVTCPFNTERLLCSKSCAAYEEEQIAVNKSFTFCGVEYGEVSIKAPYCKKLGVALKKEK